MVYLGRIVLVIVFLFRDEGGGMMDGLMRRVPAAVGRRQGITGSSSTGGIHRIVHQECTVIYL